MIDYYLKFTNEEEALSVLYTEVPIAWDNSDSENPIPTEFGLQQNYTNIDVIGVMVNDDGQYDEEGNVVVEPTVKDGWHVNVRISSTEDGTPLEQYAIHPDTPTRVWS